MVAAHGQPAWLAYGAYIGEVIAPLLVLAGFWVGPAALVMALNMVVAIALAHAHQVFQLGPQGGWAIELQGLFLVGSLAVALMAPPSSK
jgi:putative oxidoreductase